MGMYTEFHFNVELKKDVPTEVTTTLEFMLVSLRGKSALNFETPDHDLFGSERWHYMLLSNS